MAIRTPAKPKFGLNNPIKPTITTKPVKMANNLKTSTTKNNISLNKPTKPIDTTAITNNTFKNFKTFKPKGNGKNGKMNKILGG